MAHFDLIYIFPFYLIIYFMKIFISNKLILINDLQREPFAIINLYEAYLGGATNIINWIIKII